MTEDNLKKSIEKAYKSVAINFPIEQFVSVNPLEGLTNHSFGEAFSYSMRFFGSEKMLTLFEETNRQTIKWSQIYFGSESSKLSMPLSGESFYEAFKVLAVYDNALKGSKQERYQFLSLLKRSPEKAISWILQKLGVEQNFLDTFLTLTLTTLPGWSGYIKCLSQKTPEIVFDFLAVRLTLFYFLGPGVESIRQAFEEEMPKSSLDTIEAAENDFQKEFLASLQVDSKKTSSKVQGVFCIDTRSERLRKQLEQRFGFETFGFGGFFGLSASFDKALTNEVHDNCPAILEPSHLLKESLEPNCCKTKAIKRKHGLLQFLLKSYKSLKYTFSTPLILVEILGLPIFTLMCLRSFFQRTYKKVVGLKEEELSIKIDMSFMQIEEKVAIAENFLRTIGLTSNFAEAVLICGHGSETTNNAYKAALDCGACGGRHGCSNARALTTLLNSPDVREPLRAQGIAIPSHTTFIAAKHITTTDEIVLLDKKGLPKSTYLKELENNLKTISAPQYEKVKSSNWAEVRPEWGLINNAAIVFGPRSLTKELDLKGRVFLHSYDYKQDTSGALLQNLLLGPLTVAQWINSQYLFSSQLPWIFGAGSKVTSNLLGNIGSLQGNASDLMTGLPYQSLFIRSGKCLHKPCRLLVVVYAQVQEVLTKIQELDHLKSLILGEWIFFKVLDPKTQKLCDMKDLLMLTASQSQEAALV